MFDEFRVTESPYKILLALVQELVESPLCPHKTTHVRDKVFPGSLVTQILTLEIAIGENLYNDFAELSEHILTNMKLAQKLNLLFTFRR